MIYLFTDFGPTGPYTGQVIAEIHRHAPNVPVVDLVNDAPIRDPRAASYLLASLAKRFRGGDVVLGIVDPGVGSERRPVAVQAGGVWYVGPDNGLFNSIAVQAGDSHWDCLDIPEGISSTFHGRDLFAPVAATKALGNPVPGQPCVPPMELADWPADLAEIIYIDHFGNAMTGLRLDALGQETVLEVGDHKVPSACTYADVSPGATLWYENSNGLAEIAVNRGSASKSLGLRIGAVVTAG